MSDYIKQSYPKLWLIGTGHMAIAYANVLKAQKVNFHVIGRGQASADLFYNQTGIQPEVGGLEAVLSRVNVELLPQLAIVAVNVDALTTVTLQLLRKGVKKILVEKPVGLSLDEINQVTLEASKQHAQVYVGYNRRFYSSVIRAKQLIEEDGGVKSFHFEFTEWRHVIEKLAASDKIKREWFLANSTHVIDLAFYLGGTPEQMHCFTSGGLPWHPTASIYSGAGITDQGALFSYQANWEGPGRWALELVTNVRRYIFRPLEKLQVQQLNTVQIENYALDDQLDLNYKSGIYRQVSAFLSLSESSNDLLSIQQHWYNCEKIYKLINKDKGRYDHNEN